MPYDPGAGERPANRNLPKPPNPSEAKSEDSTATEPTDPPKSTRETAATTGPTDPRKPEPRARRLGDLLPGRAAEDDPERWGDRDGDGDDDRIRREVPPHHG